MLKFVDQSENNDALAEYIAEEVSVYLTNNDQGFDVYDRHYLTQVLDEHKLNMSGVIDESTAKQVGEFSGADALVVGRFSILGESVKIWVKVIDTQTAMQIAADNITISLDKTTRFIIQSNPSSTSAAGSPTNKPEAMPLRESSEPKTSSVCFERTPGVKHRMSMTVKLFDKSSGKLIEQIIADPNGSHCAYDVKEGIYIVKVFNGYNLLKQEYQIRVQGGASVVKTLPDF